MGCCLGITYNGNTTAIKVFNPKHCLPDGITDRQKKKKKKKKNSMVYLLNHSVASCDTKDTKKDLFYSIMCIFTIVLFL